MTDRQQKLIENFMERMKKESNGASTFNYGMDMAFGGAKTVLELLGYSVVTDGDRIIIKGDDNDDK